MKRCAFCLSENFNDAFYCGNCGKKLVPKLQPFCPRCEEEIETRFCTFCGTRAVLSGRYVDVQHRLYRTVLIGRQEWLAKNLAVTVDRNGIELELGKDYFFPNGDPCVVSNYGLLYTWDAAQRIAPKGWHIPTAAEWDELIYCCGNSACDGQPFSVSKALASISGWKNSNTDFSVGKDQDKNNFTGFNALPAGTYQGEFLGFGYGAAFWSATKYNLKYAIRYSMSYSNPVFGRIQDEKTSALSVRCVKDDDNC